MATTIHIPHSAPSTKRWAKQLMIGALAAGTLGAGALFAATLGGPDAGPVSVPSIAEAPLSYDLDPVPVAGTGVLVQPAEAAFLASVADVAGGSASVEPVAVAGTGVLVHPAEAAFLATAATTSAPTIPAVVGCVEQVPC